MQDYARIVHQRGVIFRALFHIKLSMHWIIYCELQVVSITIDNELVAIKFETLKNPCDLDFQLLTFELLVLIRKTCFIDKCNLLIHRHEQIKNIQ
jgi:hypothetical protein